MRLIDQLIDQIQGMPVDNSKNLTLKASDFRLASGKVDVELVRFMKVFFAKLLKVESLTLTGAVKTLSANSITITGSADLLGYHNLALSIVFDVQDDELVGTVTGVF